MVWKRALVCFTTIVINRLKIDFRELLVLEVQAAVQVFKVFRLVSVWFVTLQVIRLRIGVKLITSLQGLFVKLELAC